MKHYRAINKEDTTKVLYITVNETITTFEDLPEHVVLEDSGYILSECSQNEIDRMTSNINDYIINVGQDKQDLGPFESAHTREEAIARAEKLSTEYPMVEIVYMPVDEYDINEIIWSKYN